MATPLNTTYPINLNQTQNLASDSCKSSEDGYKKVIELNPVPQTYSGSGFANTTTNGHSSFMQAAKQVQFP
jgi:hypothetical protein